MFTELVEGLVATTDTELDQAVRASELALRAHTARHAALVAIAQHRHLYAADGHRTMKAYLRATCNGSGTQHTAELRLAQLLSAHPVVGDGLLAGRFSVGHALEIGRFHANPRIRQLLPVVVGVLVEQAEHRSYDDFRGDVDQLITLLDQDGAYARIAQNVECRTARVNDTGGTLDIVATGGDPIVAAQMQAVFESFVQGEYRRDVEARAAGFGDQADQHPLPRTAAQRRFDALVSIFAAAAASPEGRALPEPTVAVVIDHRSMGEAFAAAAITLPDGNQVDLGELTETDSTLLETLADELVDDPEAFCWRTCRLSTGTAIHPTVALRAAFLGHIRRVVVDSDGVVIDLGVKQRLFAGNARTAALLLNRYCTHPGCRIPAFLCQVDHIEEWADGGRTDQSNAGIQCAPHNRHKSRRRWRTRRDRRGRTYTIRADGTIILPVGERPPDLSWDEMAHAARARLSDLTRVR